MGAFDFLREGQVQHGTFGAVTSTIDWCELNFVHTPHVAELVNTLTNVPVVLLGLYGARAHAAMLPRRYAGGFLGLALIGAGSFGFHMTLKWGWQLMDELPMIYVVSYSALMVLDTLPTFTHRFGVWGYLVLLAWDVFVTFSYISLPNPVYHQIAFAGLMTFTVFRSIYLLRSLPAGHALRTAVSRTLLRGVATFVAGFAVWNVDNLFCEQLRAARRCLGGVGVGALGHFLEGHGYWHLMTGYGAYLIMVACTALCVAIKTHPDAYMFDPHAWVPVIRPTSAKPVPAAAAAAARAYAKASSSVIREKKEDTDLAS
ncbi:alkaline ceramidase ydc1 [Cryptotrichosporon argae]